MTTGRRTRSKDEGAVSTESPNSAKVAARKKVEKRTSPGSTFEDRKQRVDHELYATFRRFLMSPGQMLCFAGPDLAYFRDALSRLTESGHLVAEAFPGGYSLTHKGFSVMRLASSVS